MSAVDVLEHTLGPWLMLNGSECTGRQVDDWAVTTNGTGTWICIGPTWDAEFQSESQANARLIASAPELLGELKWLVELLDDGSMYDHEVFDAARAAIAKATGATP